MSPAEHDPSAESVPSDGGPLVFVEDLEDPRLDPQDLHHLARVRRIRDGDDLVVADGNGAWRRCLMAGDRPRPGSAVAHEPRLHPGIGVGFALVKGSKPELAVQKLTEAGVDTIVPFTAVRSVVRWDTARAENALARLTKVAREAAMQSRRARLPRVEAVTTFAVASARRGACRADRGGGPISLDHPLVLIGPEGGWDPTERAVELPVVGLGPGVLRAETATIAAGILLGALRSGLVGPSPT